MLVVQVRAAITTEDGQTRVCHVDAAPRQLGLLKLPASAVSGPNRCQWKKKQDSLGDFDHF